MKETQKGRLNMIKTRYKIIEYHNETDYYV